MAAKRIEIHVDLVQGNTGTKVKAALKDVDDEVSRINKRTADSKKQTEKIILEATKQRAKAELDIEKTLERSKKNYLKSVESAAKDSARKMKGIFGDVFAGTFLGMGAYDAVTGGLSKAFSGLKTAFEKSLDFSQMKISLAQFEGSVEKAEERIRILNKTAQDTPGLSFLSAIEGQKRLEAIGFQADQATQILTGLAKVRVLSGASKEDFDAMLVNLVQIANGGQTVTQELREMATRMPAIIGIIKKEFGSIGKELNDIDPKEFVTRLAGAMAKVQADANQSGLAIENLKDAFDRLYIAVGSVIEQNPDVLAALRVLTHDIDDNTNALLSNESQSRSTFSTFVSWAAKGSIALRNFVDEASDDLLAVGNFLAAIINGMVAGTAKMISIVPQAINESIIKPFNTLKQALGGMGALIPGLGQILGINGEIPLIPTADALGNQAFRAAQINLAGVTNAGSKRRSAGRWQAFEDEKIFAEFEAYKKREREKNRKMGGNANVYAGGSDVSPGGGGGRGRVRAAANTDDRRWRDIQEFAQEQGFTVTSGFRTKGTTGAHAAGIAADIRTTGKTTDEIGQFVATAIEKGFRVVDERVKIANSPFWSGPHLHLETNNRRESQLNSNLSYGNVPVGLLRELDNKRFSKKNVTKDEIDAYYEKHALKTEGAGIITEIDLSNREKEIQLGKEQIAVYTELQEALFNLTEHSKEEAFWFDYKLGKYPQFNEEQAKEIANVYKLIDATEQKNKVEEESKRERERQYEEMQREQERLFEDTRRNWEDLLNDLANGNFKNIWHKFRQQMLDAFIKPASNYLAQLFGGGMGGGMQPAMAGGGFNLGGLFGGGGGNMGPGGTPYFNPISQFAGGGGGMTGGGGILGMLQGAFGGGGRGAAPEPAAAAAGMPWLKTLGGSSPIGGAGGGFGGMLRGMGGGSMMAGIGSGLGQLGMIAGSAVGGKWGNLLSLTGMGASIGASFGPWGAAIGAGIGAGAGLISMLFMRDNSLKKLKEAAASEFGISVKDKDILKQLKAIGEQYFGKGQAGKNAQATVRTEEGMNILRAYAESTGQSGLKIDRLNYGDENWSGNQFRGQFGGFRARGGHVSAGVSYIVGERRPEVFTPSTSGTISPSVSMSDPQLKAILAQVEEALQTFTEKFEGVSPDKVLMAGAAINPYAVSHAQNEAMSRDPRGAESLQRNQGIY